MLTSLSGWGRLFLLSALNGRGQLIAAFLFLNRCQLTRVISVLSIHTLWHPVSRTVLFCFLSELLATSHMAGGSCQNALENIMTDGMPHSVQFHGVCWASVFMISRRELP